MGMSPFSRSTEPGEPPLPPPNPNPTNFTIHAARNIGRFLVVQIQYPDCTNYEGVKILVYENVSIEELNRRTHIDPHFRPGPGTPIARFEPTERGWERAKIFCRALMSLGA